MAINLVVQNGEDIQTYLDIAEQNGGGSVMLSAGTYYPTSDINIPIGVYLVGAVRSATTIDFANQSYSVSSVGVVDAHVSDILVKNLTIQNSTSYGLYLEYVDASEVNGADTIDCEYGIYFKNCSGTGIIGEGTATTGCTTGIKMENCDATSLYFSSVGGCSGNGMELVNSTALTIFDVGFNDNTGSGLVFTDCSGIGIVSSESLSNGSIGVELTGGNSDIQFTATPINNNGSDGLKSTADNINITITSSVFRENGGYGVNVANVSCNSNLISSNHFISNSLGAVNDSGTDTLIRSNIGVADSV